jgi:hypothetical protein
MTKIRTTQDKLNAEGEIFTRNLELSFEYGTLIVSEINIENEKETITPIMVQPWKCLPDGGREQFKDANDAFEWLESVKSNLI